MPKVCLTIFSCVVYKYNITFILFKAVYYETVVKNKLKRTWYSIFYSCMSANVNRPFKLYKKVNWVPLKIADSESQGLYPTIIKWNFWKSLFYEAVGGL